MRIDSTRQRARSFVSMLESLALSVYERLGLDPEVPASIFTIASRMLGPGAIIRPHWMRSPAALYYQNGSPRIALRKGLPIERAAFLCGHELAHVLLNREGRRAEDEADCDYLAGALLAPRPAIHSFLRQGLDYQEIADEVVASHTWAALRTAEVTGHPVALVTPARVRVRGVGWIWPPEDALRRLAKTGGPGVTRVRLRDDPSRTLLKVIAA